MAAVVGGTVVGGSSRAVVRNVRSERKNEVPIRSSVVRVPRLEAGRPILVAGDGKQVPAPGWSGLGGAMPPMALIIRDLKIFLARAKIFDTFVLKGCVRLPFSGV